MIPAVSVDSAKRAFNCSVSRESPSKVDPVQPPKQSPVPPAYSLCLVQSKKQRLHAI